MGPARFHCATLLIEISNEIFKFETFMLKTKVLTIFKWYFVPGNGTGRIENKIKRLK